MNLKQIIKESKFLQIVVGFVILTVVAFVVLRDNNIVLNLLNRNSGTVQNTENGEAKVQEKLDIADPEQQAQKIEELKISEEKSKDLYEQCLEDEDQYERVTCLLPYFESMTIKEGAEVALERAKELKKNSLITDCHLPAHAIGHANFIKHGKNLGQAFIKCPLGCFEGCFHGVIEGYGDMAGNIDDLITPTSIPTICSDLGNDRKLKLHCVHGIGHGMMRHGAGQVLGKLDVCERLIDIDYRSGCSSGVIMENMNTYLWYKEPELRAALPKICEPIANSTTHNDLMWLCIQEIGDGLMAYTGDPVKANKLCEVLAPELAAQCKKDVAGSRHNPEDALHTKVE